MAKEKKNNWGEGCFILTIIKDKKYKLGWRAACRFVISLNKKDLKILNDIKDLFCCR